MKKKTTSYSPYFSAKSKSYVVEMRVETIAGYVYTFLLSNEQPVNEVNKPWIMLVAS